MLAVTYLAPTDHIAAFIKALTLCAALVAAVLITIAVAPMLYVCVYCIIKTVVVASLAASPLLIIKLQKKWSI